MLEFSLPIGPFPWDRDTRRKRRDRIRELATFLVCPVGYRKKKKKTCLFPPQGDVFVTIDMLTSTGIKVVSETSKKPGHGNKAVHHFVLSSLFGWKGSFTVCN